MQEFDLQRLYPIRTLRSVHTLLAVRTKTLRIQPHIPRFFAHQKSCPRKHGRKPCQDPKEQSTQEHLHQMALSGKDVAIDYEEAPQESVHGHDRSASRLTFKKPVYGTLATFETLVSSQCKRRPLCRHQSLNHQTNRSRYSIRIAARGLGIQPHSSTPS